MPLAFFRLQFPKKKITVENNFRYARQFLNQRPPSYEIRLDKPPSYEECTRSSTRGLLFESPPPYVISTNIPADLNRNEQTTNSVAFSTPNLTPLNVQSLGVTLQQVSYNIY